MTAHTAQAEDVRLSVLEALEMRTDAEVEALTCDQLSLALEVLLDALVAKETLYHEAMNELRATDRLRRLAMKHEDLALARGLSEDAAYLQQVVPRYADTCGRYWTQWGRYWEALLKYRLPDKLHEALHTIAATEGRSPLDQITRFLHDAVTQWQEQHEGERQPL
jgi:hypothetical protein